MSASRPKVAVIIGAGPAGLTAAYELLTRTDIKPIVIEMDDHVGGISRTVNYKGNRIDIGGHRFFSKSDRVMNWWFQHLPIQGVKSPSSDVLSGKKDAATPVRISYQGKSREIGTAGQFHSTNGDAVMLVRERRSRIYFLRKFFDYPISLSPDTIRKLGLIRTAAIGISYAYRVLFPLKEQTNLEQFFINRFGEKLYRTFFKSYTEKVWGVPCTHIDAEWGAQRIKELSIWKTIKHFLSNKFRKRADVSQKQVETSLIERFLYPKYGPGQMWEEVAKKVQQMGGTIIMGQAVQQIHAAGTRVTGVTCADSSGSKTFHQADYTFSTMPVQELIGSLQTAVPANVREVSDGLMYRDFITVGLLLQNLKITDDTQHGSGLIRDNWIYIQESDVLAGRLQIFNNWSPWMVSDPGKVWVGVEYFCNEGDELWTRTEPDLKQLAVDELEKIGIIDKGAVLDSMVLRMPKAYPAYFGTYARFKEVRDFLDGFDNLFLIGRNGMHRYNNQDHSMLTAMTAVDNIISGRKDKENIWSLNTDMEYHEERIVPERPKAVAATAGR
jgi:protoporphyrinogen oxidase